MPEPRFHTDYLPCNIYIDAANVRKHLEEVGLSGGFDPRRLAELVRTDIIGGMPLSAARTFFYDAVDHTMTDQSLQRQDKYFQQIELLPDTHIVLGSVGRAQGHRTQKGVDVQLAVDALNAAWSGIVAAVAIVSGDADFVPLVDAIRGVGPHVLVMSFESSLSHELRQAADRVLILPDRPRDWTLTPD
jgi:uncharacterized LabA/DUF88 family protein